MKSYDVVLLEKPDNNGLTRDECTALFDKINDDEVYPVEIPNTNGTSFAIGIISTTAADNINYDMTELTAFIRKILVIQKILDNINLESADREYEFSGLSICMIQKRTST